MEKEFTPEMFQKFKEVISTANSAEEILALAKERGMELTLEKAQELFVKYHKS